MDPMVVSSLISAGGSILGGLMGNKGSKSGAKALKAYAEALQKAMALQEGIYKEYQKITDPFREAIYGDIINTLGAENPEEYLTGLPYYKNIRTPLETQYRTATRDVEKRIPTSAGGAFSRAIARVASDRASQVGLIPGSIYKNYWDEALKIAAPKHENFMAGIASVAQGYGPLINAASGQQATGTQMMYQGATGLGRALYDILNTGGTTGGGGGGSSSLLDYRYGYSPSSISIDAGINY